MSRIFDDKFKNTIFNGIKDVAISQLTIENTTTSAKNLISSESLEYGQIIKGIIISKDINGEAVFSADEGNLLLVNATLKKGDKLELLIENYKGQLFGKITSVNDQIVNEYIPIKHNNTKVKNSESSSNNSFINNSKSGSSLAYNSLMNSPLAKKLPQSLEGNFTEIIDFTGHNLIQEGVEIKASVSFINKAKFQEELNKLKVNFEENGSSIAPDKVAGENLNTEELSFKNMFDQKLTLEQNKILFTQLKGLVLNTALDLKVIKINNENSQKDDSLSTLYPLEIIHTDVDMPNINISPSPPIRENGLKYDNQRLILQGKIVVQEEKVHILSDIGMFEVSKDFESQAEGTITLEILNITSPKINPINNIIDKFSRFLLSDFTWNSLEESLKFILPEIGENNNIQEKISLPTLDQSFLKKIINFEENIKHNNVHELLTSKRHIPNSLIAEADSEAYRDFYEDVQNITLLNKNLIQNNPNSWQFIIIPIYQAQQLDYIKSFHRHDEKDPTAMRFIVEFVTKTMGNIQLDGFIRFLDLKHKKIDNFTLIIRSRLKMEDQIKGEIEAIFLANQEIQGIKGAIRFEEYSHFLTNPSQDILTQILNTSKNFSV